MTAPPATAAELVGRLCAAGHDTRAATRAAALAMATPRKAAHRLVDRQAATEAAPPRYPPSIPPALEADALEAALEELKRCRRCGTELTDPDSIRRGLGPDCAKVAG